MVIPNHSNWDYNDYSPSPWIPSEVKATPRAYINYQHLNELMRTIVPNFGTKSGMWNYGGGDHFETNRQYTYQQNHIKNVFQSARDEFVKEVYQYIESVQKSKNLELSPKRCFVMVRSLNYPLKYEYQNVNLIITDAHSQMAIENMNITSPAMTDRIARFIRENLIFRIYFR